MKHYHHISWYTIRSTKASVTFHSGRTVGIVGLCSEIISGDVNCLAPMLNEGFFVHPDQIPLPVIWVSIRVLLD